MNQDSERRTAARLAVEKAILEFARCARVESEDEYAEEDPIVIGWVVALEVTTVGLEQADKALTLRICPTGQARSMTIGLLADSQRGMG